jgi:hypothetical protein
MDVAEALNGLPLSSLDRQVDDAEVSYYRDFPFPRSTAHGKTSSGDVSTWLLLIVANGSGTIHRT